MSLAYVYGVKLAEASTETPVDNEPPSFWRRNAVPLAGLATAAVSAPLIYHYLRKRRLSADPALRAIQEQSGGVFHRVRSGSAQERGPVGRAFDKLIYGGGGNVHYTDDLRRQVQTSGGMKSVPGVVMHDSPDRPFIHGVGGNLISNDVNDRVSRDFANGNKHVESRIFEAIAPGSMGRTESVAEVLGNLGHPLNHPSPSQSAKQVDAFRRTMGDNGGRRAAMLEGLESDLRARYPGGYLLKDVDASATGGKFPSDSHNLRDLLAGDGPEAKTLVNAVKDPRSVIVQEKLPLAQGNFVDRMLAKVRGLPSTKEVRVHVMNGAVVPELTVPRFSPTMWLTGRKQMRGADDYARELMSKMPEAWQGGTFAMDVAPLTTGGYKLIESNPGYRSGFLSAGNHPLIGPLSHKAFTGQNSALVSGIGAAAGAGALGLGAKAVAGRVQDQTPEKADGGAAP